MPVFSWGGESKLPQSYKAVTGIHMHSGYFGQIWPVSVVVAGCLGTEALLGEDALLRCLRHGAPSILHHCALGRPHTHLSCLWVITESFGRKKGSTGEGEEEPALHGKCGTGSCLPPPASLFLWTSHFLLRSSSQL